MTRWLIFLLVVSTTAFSQQIIHGSVVDKETGSPVPFASVGIVGKSQGTSTNLDGQFSIAVSGAVMIKITCIGYVSVTINSSDNIHLIQLAPDITQLNEVIITNKVLNPRAIVRKAFSNISRNYSREDFLQKFFYRHYCKDDFAYGRLIEASVDILKHQGYRNLRKSAGDREEIRITQLRRSLDNTIMAQGHEPISVENILQADIAGFQTSEKSMHLGFYDEASNLKTDFENYIYTVEGITMYDGKEVYKINYTYKEDSILMTSGYMPAPKATGSLFITTDSYAFLKTEDVKYFGPNIITTSAFYRKYGDKYYPYHFIRAGESNFPDNHNHSFHIELMSVEIQNHPKEKFEGRQPGKSELLKIPYDSVFWSTQTVLKTTPLEDKIIHDLGGGSSLNKQFYRYQQYEWSTSNGRKNGVEKFNWFKEDSKDRRILYLCFWGNNFQPYIKELEQIKKLNKTYRNKITFILLSVDSDEMRWEQIQKKYNLFSDGIINYRIDEKSELTRLYKIKETPTFILISKDGREVDPKAKHPLDAALEDDFKSLLEQGLMH